LSYGGRNPQKKHPLRVACIFYVLIYVITYVSSYVVITQYTYLNFLQRILTNAVITSVMFLVAYSISKRFLGSWNLRMVGLIRENFVKSFLLASAALTPIQIFIIIGANLIGINSFRSYMAVPWLTPPYNPWLPLFAIVLWSLYGLFSFSILQAFPYEILKNHKYTLLVISALWIGLYNAPLLTGEFLPEDILFLGIIFLVVYHRTRNALGLIPVYVLLYEGPILWIIGVAWGEGVLLVTIYARMIWCIVSALILVWYRLKKQEYGSPISRTNKSLSTLSHHPKVNKQSNQYSEDGFAVIKS
jgi:hypothetical protein